MQLPIMNKYINTNHYYSMYTNEGNQAVHAIVENAIKHNTPWSKVLNSLSTLAHSNKDLYSEATDTAVRESVHITIYADEYAKRNELNMNCFSLHP